MMRFSLMTTLCFNFVLCQGERRLENRPISINGADDTLEQFFVEFNRAYLERNAPQSVLVIGGSTDDLHRAHPSFDNYPHVLCTDLERCFYPSLWNAGSFVIIFLEDLTAHTLTKKVKTLSDTRHRCKFLFVYEGKGLPIDEIASLLAYRQSLHAVHAEFVHLEGNVVRHYNIYLTPNCTFATESRFAWKFGSDLSSINAWAFESPKNFNGCPVSVAAFESRLNMVFEEKPNGSLTIVGGLEGRLIMAIAEKLHFTISLKRLSIFGHRRSNSAKSQIVHQVANQLAEFGIGQLRPTGRLLKKTQFSRAYAVSCVTWGVSLENNRVQNLVWAEFSWKVWTLIGVIFVITCVLNHVYYETCGSSRNDGRRGVTLVAAVLDVVSMSLGNPVINVATSIGGRVLLMFCLLYATVMTTAYKSSLSSILTSSHPSPIATDLVGILKANLSVSGSQYNLDILKDLYAGQDDVLESLRRFDTVDDASGAPKVLRSGQRVAYFAERSTLKHLRYEIAADHELIRFGVLDDCALVYPTVIVVRRGSFFLRSVDDTIQDLLESGIPQHWASALYPVDVRTLNRENDFRWSMQQMRLKFRDVFTFYGCCIAICISAFFIELIAAKLYSKNIRCIICPIVRRWRMRARRF